MRPGDNNFYNLLSRLVTASNPDRDRDEWEVEGVHWRRARHIRWSPLSFQIETYRLVHAACPRRSLVLHETSWGRNRSKTIRNAHWTHLESGDRRDVFKWSAEREKAL